MIPAGYNAKIIAAPGEWIDNSTVVEVLSVGDCFSKTPIDPLELWICNNWILFDSEADLERAILHEQVQEAGFRRFYYESYERQFFDGEWAPIPDPPTKVAKPDAGYSLMGYDIVCWEQNCGPGCCPLSCNGGVNHFPVNRFCLIDTLEDALRITLEVDKGGYEPGPYRVVSVWEKS